VSNGTLACPFCGGAGEPGQGGLGRVVACRVCEAQTGEFRTEAEAKAAWNVRSPARLSGESGRNAGEVLSDAPQYAAGSGSSPDVGSPCLGRARSALHQILEYTSSIEYGDVSGSWLHVQGLARHGLGEKPVNDVPGLGSVAFAIKNTRCSRYDMSADATDSCDGPDWCDDCATLIATAVRRAAITEAVDRLTDEQVERLVVRMMGLTPAQSRAALRRALTEGT
jgi:hypothetical protein